jgi:hypothetical protein
VPAPQAYKNNVNWTKLAVYADEAWAVIQLHALAAPASGMSCCGRFALGAAASAEKKPTPLPMVHTTAMIYHRNHSLEGHDDIESNSFE